MTILEAAPPAAARNGTHPAADLGDQLRCEPRGLRIDRLSPAPDPYAGIVWERRNARILEGGDADRAVFAQDGVEFPADWSMQATNICAQKYFRGELGSAQREWSLRQLIDRVADTITKWGSEDGYFASSGDAEAFGSSLKWLLVSQAAAFNSPVWFNIGVADTPQQASACFILDVQDSLDGILNWYTEEGRIFKGGSGSGVNLSRLRADGEPLRGGGQSSGPLSFMRGADASAGTIRSGGKTRRAAKMVLLDDDHPDLERFIWCKAKEEDKARALAAAGFDMSFDGDAAASLAYQNANNSVRLSDAFMAAAEAGETWRLRGRVSDTADRDVDAAGILAQIAEAAWQCADPGVQFSDTINSWHTSPSGGPIEGSNPCSEYMSVSNSACNLASLNIGWFHDDTGRFDVALFSAAVRIMIIAQDILVDRAHYPTALIGQNTRRYRQLGLGITNLGAALMRRGVAYSSPEGFAFAASVCSLLGGEAYAASAELARALAPFDMFDADRDAVVQVLARHSRSASELAEGAAGTAHAPIAAAGAKAWALAQAAARNRGIRNAQTTVIAPTGTISFMMDCSTTGIEPALALVATKKLAGGGELRIVNEAVPAALDALGYAPAQRDRICAHIDAAKSLADPGSGLDPEHLEVFACAMGDVVVSPEAHIDMMAACQPFVSGAISKTVNLPGTAKAADIESLIWRAHRGGVKAVAFFVDGCKASQPLQVATAKTAAAPPARPADSEAAVEPVRERRELPRHRRANAFSFNVAGCRGHLIAGEYEDGAVGELFLKVSKQGSTFAGICDAFARAVSLGLQHGVPLSSYVSGFTQMRFEPSGITDDPEVRQATSLMDYIGHRLALSYLSDQERAELGVFATGQHPAPTLPGVAEAAAAVSQPPSIDSDRLCFVCGDQMVRAGSCFTCQSCGATSGCG